MGNYHQTTQHPVQSKQSAVPTLVPHAGELLLDRELPPGNFTPIQARQLQRLIGNQAATRLIQAKLQVGPAGDHYEQEADRVAAQVLTMPAPPARQAPPPVQRKLRNTISVLGAGVLQCGKNKEQRAAELLANTTTLNSIRNDILTPLKDRNWLKAYYNYQAAGITYHKAGFFGSMKLTKYLQGVLDLNAYRKQAKSIPAPKDDTEVPNTLDAIANIANHTHADSAPGDFAEGNIGSALGMTQKIIYYLIQAIPETTIKGQIVAETLSKAEPVKMEEKPKAVLMMGGPGSGKSSIIDKVVTNKADYVVADPDEMKKALPEYRAGVKAGDLGIAEKVHGKSKEMTQQLVGEVVTTHRNLLYDGTGGNMGEYRSMVNKLKKNNYDITLVMAHVTVTEGLRRVQERARDTGRSVPENVVKDIYSWVPSNFMDLMPSVDHAVVFDNMGPVTKEPEKVWEKGGGELKPKHVRKLKAAIGLTAPKKFKGDTDEEEYFRKIEESEFKYLSSSGFNKARDMKDALLGARGRVAGKKNTRALLKKYNLTLAEAAAIGIYTADDYKYMNPALAGNEGWMKGMLPRLGFKNMEVAKELRTGITSTHLNEAMAEGLVHSQIVQKGLAKLPNWTGQAFRGVALTPEEFAAKYPDGGTAKMEAFTSTSSQEATSKSFARSEAKKSREEKGGNKQAYLLDMTLTKGKDIKEFSNTQQEAEVLVLPGAKFSVDNIAVESEEDIKVTVKDKPDDKTGTEETQKLILTRVTLKQTD